jgi:hypothetical protein
LAHLNLFYLGHIDSSEYEVTAILMGSKEEASGGGVQEKAGAPDTNYTDHSSLQDSRGAVGLFTGLEYQHFR